MGNHMDKLGAQRLSGNEAVSQALKDWVRAAASKDGPALRDLLSEDIALFPPFQEEPMIGQTKALKTLSLFSKVTQNFSYDRTWHSGKMAVLEFTAEIEGRTLHGLDLIEFNDRGKISRIEVMARPHAAVTSLRAALLGSL